MSAQDTRHDRQSFLLKALVGLVIIGGVAMSLSVAYNTTTAAASQERMEGQLNTETPAEMVAETGTEPAPPVQAGFPGNTLPPVKPNTATPPPDAMSTDLLWKNIPPDAQHVYVGARMNGGPYDNLRGLSYFVIMQTPPKDGDIYGDLSIFVEGGKIGLRMKPATKIFDYKFDFSRRGEYRIEMKITFISAFVSRIELMIDGSSTGEEFLLRSINLRDHLYALPERVMIHDKTKSAYLQVSTPSKPQWGSIREVSTYSVYGRA